MRILLLTLLVLAMPLQAALPLLHWQDNRSSSPAASLPALSASRAWKLCALYPNLKDGYWLSINYGMSKAAARLGVTLNVFEAGGYRQGDVQQHQLEACQRWGAEAILLGSSVATFPGAVLFAQHTPIIEVVNAVNEVPARTRVGVPWYQMGYQIGHYLVAHHQDKPMQILLMPGPIDAGGSQEMSSGFRAALTGSLLKIVDVAYGDNDIEVQRNLLQDRLERYPGINLVAGTAIAAEVAMGEGRNRTTPLEIASFYLTHQVYRGLKRDRIVVAASDQMVWQGELAVEQAVRVLQGQRVPDNISPPILILTAKNSNSAGVALSLSPPGFRPVYFYQRTSAASK
ncbi:TMAO reductase system periplasmic protein TorT [Candidatus Pantoea floridensis]|uniref:Protein TorT n=1 Tax=Candidatus Pantoea floridensis TaxID=1938870 RepID=A0A286BT87_9GAMM|nr:TMAO reductase system periplasmic protein TorT [Pantoea floridensis]PIF23930.1 protein TorT [Enterobacteriaceae bacterium JKS000233]SOD37383.1 protein TorT [Pantoea floridensis]HBZ16480.1 TMAO reductase system periplasmic protein TorT [Pantoea sp.]